MYYVYILECGDGSYYTGMTTDAARRFREHQAGKGGHYTRSRKAKKIVYSERKRDRGGALRREAEIKRWSRKQKIAFINERSTKRILRTLGV